MGLVCPLVGVYLVVRRLIFMGVALPQISSCGIAFAFALQAWGVIPHIHENEHRLAFFGSTGGGTTCSPFGTTRTVPPRTTSPWEIPFSSISFAPKSERFRIRRWRWCFSKIR